MGGQNMQKERRAETISGDCERQESRKRVGNLGEFVWGLQRQSKTLGEKRKEEKKKGSSFCKAKRQK